MARIKQVLNYFLNHKKLAILAGLILIGLIYGVYSWWGGSNTTITYAFGQAEKQDLKVIVSGTGQVSASNQLEVKSETAGKVTAVNAKVGQEIKSGGLIISLDSTDAQKSVRDARSSLNSAQISYTKAKNSVTAGEDLQQKYSEAITSLPSIYSDISPMFESLDDILFQKTLSSSSNYSSNLDYYTKVISLYDKSYITRSSNLKSDWFKARDLYNQVFADYSKLNQNSSGEDIQKVVEQTYELTKKVNDLNKFASDLVLFFQDKSSQDNWESEVTSTITSHATTLKSYVTTSASDLSIITSLRAEITSLQQANKNSNLDLESQALTLAERQNSLNDALEELAKASIRAPFDGVVAKIEVKKYETVSNGTVVATLITPTKIATISMNEVDAAKVQVGQKASLTFDAIDGLSIPATVSQVDQVGEVDQGVVSYNVEIIFDQNDDRVKPGMSVNAEIMVADKNGVLAVPNTAIKTDKKGNYYVQVASDVKNVTASARLSADQVTLKKQIVKIGLVNDDSTEIMSGLNEGDYLVIKTITSSTSGGSTSGSSSSNRQSVSLFGGSGGPPGGMR